MVNSGGGAERLQPAHAPAATPVWPERPPAAPLKVLLSYRNCCVWCCVRLNVSNSWDYSPAARVQHFCPHPPSHIKVRHGLPFG